SPSPLSTPLVDFTTCFRHPETVRASDNVLHRRQVSIRNPIHHLPPPLAPHPAAPHNWPQRRPGRRQDNPGGLPRLHPLPAPPHSRPLHRRLLPPPRRPARPCRFPSHQRP